ncbi:MAG: hypothetical protein L3K15_06985 [Thermoplasmata archaeon]|nr:hypothetical protein [Thermoplasmata archaeon]
MVVAPDIVLQPPGGSDDPRTGELASALQRLSGGGGTVHLTKGTYFAKGPAVIPSNTTVDFQDVTVRIGYAGLFLKTLPGTHGVRLIGNLAFVGNRGDFGGISFYGTSDLSIETRVDVSGIAPNKQFLLFDRCQNGKVLGGMRSSDSRLVLATDSSSLEVGGVHAGPYRLDPGDSIVRVICTGAHGPTSGIYLHDIDIDGGNVLATTSPVYVASAKGQPPIHDVTVARCRIRNTLALVDGVDVGRCVGVTVSDIYGEGVNVALAVVASSATVSKVEGRRCRAQAFEYGDPKYQTDDISGLEADGIVARDCGLGWGGVFSSGIGIFASPGTSTSNVRLRNVDAMDTDGKSQRFGLGVGEGVHDVRVEGGRLYGFAGRVRSLVPDSELTLVGVA